MKTTLFTKPGCSDSDATRAMLVSQEVDFKEVVVEDPNNAPIDMRMLGWGGHFPFLVVALEEPSNTEVMAVLLLPETLQHAKSWQPASPSEQQPPPYGTPAD